MEYSLCLSCTRISPSRGEPLTGEPDAGEPHVRFGGRGNHSFSLPLLRAAKPRRQIQSTIYLRIAMHNLRLEQAFADLFAWCRERDFAGYDPFDGLNSRLFR